MGDYLLYSHLGQDELGFSVFGHRDPFKNIKRKYVFDITYGYYDVRTAHLQDRLRDVLGQLRVLRSQQSLLNVVFDGTALENRAGIEHELREVNREIATCELQAVETAKPPDKPEDTAQLQADVLDLERETMSIRAALDAEQRGLQNLRELTAQFEAQSGRLTRSIVSHKHLTDLEFSICPRCGSDVAEDRAENSICYLCLQEPSLHFSRDVLVSEQGAVEQQLAEAQDLIGERTAWLTDLETQLTEADEQLTRKRLELDFQTRSYVSERASQIASTAAHRARLTARAEQLEEYLRVLGRVDSYQKLAAKLSVKKCRIEQDLAETAVDTAEACVRVDLLKERYNNILERFSPPQFGEEESSDLNPKTHLPIYHGRPFDELSSPGLATLVNVAHAIAHHLTAIELGLKLPHFLIIDGLSEHLGSKGLDPQRWLAVYQFLIETSTAHPELQVIVVDNEIPPEARSFVRLELSDEDRLVRAGSITAASRGHDE